MASGTHPSGVMSNYHYYCPICGKKGVVGSYYSADYQCRYCRSNWLDIDEFRKAGGNTTLDENTPRKHRNERINE